MKRPYASDVTRRIIFFSDAVFAIAVTLLVLDIRVPSVPQDLAASELPQAIAALWPKFLSYIISFVVIGLYCWCITARSATSPATTIGWSR